MKRSIKVLSLSIPLSFALGLGLSFYFEQKRKNPDYFKPSITILTPKSLDFSSLKSRWQGSLDFAIRVVECTSNTECRERMSPSIDLAILPGPMIKGLVAKDLLLNMPDEILTLKSNLHVDFQRPYFDPETLHSLPLYWNVNGYICPSDKCSRLESANLSQMPEEYKKEIFFVDDADEQTHLVKSGLWEDAMAVSHDKRLDVLKKENRPIVQWPSGAISQRQLFKLNNHKYTLPKFGATISVFALVFPKSSPNGRARIQFAKELLDPQFVKKTIPAVPAASTIKVEESEDLDIRKLPQFLRSFELYRLKFENATS